MDLLGRVERICAAGLPDRPLRARLLEAIRPSVGFDAHVFALTDPATRVGVDPSDELPTIGPGVVVLDADLRVRTQTDPAAR